MRDVLNSAIDKLKQNPPPDPGHTGGGPLLSSQRYPGIFGKTFNVLHLFDPTPMPGPASSKQAMKRQSNAETDDILPRFAEEENEINFFRRLCHGAQDAIVFFSGKSSYTFSRKSFPRRSGFSLEQAIVKMTRLLVNSLLCRVVLMSLYGLTSVVQSFYFSCCSFCFVPHRI